MAILREMAKQSFERCVPKLELGNEKQLGTSSEVRF
jgi:hypothetical protein